MPVRKVVTRSGRGYRGNFPSKKVNKMVSFESILERDAIKLFENDPFVLSFEEQPTTIIFFDELGYARRYVPDFEVILVTGEIIHVEIKPVTNMFDKDTFKKYQLISQNYVYRKEIFILLTCQDIRVDLPNCMVEFIQSNWFKGAQ